jgi:amino acid transporter
LNPLGLILATAMMLMFTIINLVGVKFLAESNTVTVIWKIAIPALTVLVLLFISFHGSNFTSAGGFMPYGAHGVFAALPAGLVFAMQGFEQAIQMGGEARNPQRDISRAVIIAMVVGTLLYIALEIAFIGGIDPAQLAKGGWSQPMPVGDFGPYATIATAAGAAWLASLLYVDAFISPAGTGLLYVGTSSRLSYALGRQKTAPPQLARVSLRGVPIVSIIVAFIIGELCFLPFPSWSSLVVLVTSATAIMYAFAPVSLTALRRIDADRERPYHLPAPAVLSPIGFVAANMIIYWGGFEATWKLSIAIVLGLALFGLTRVFTSAEDRPAVHAPNAIWVPVWLIGLNVIGYLGRYGVGAQSTLGNWWDLVVVLVFSLVIFYWAVGLSVDSECVRTAVEAEQDEIEGGPELNVQG